MESIVFEEQNNDLDIEFISNDVQKIRNFPDPYKMDPNNVQMKYFREARLYDEINEPGWRIQSYMVKRNYQNWLRKIRSQPGMRRFRRYIDPNDEVKENSSSYTTNSNQEKPVTQIVRSNTNRNRNIRLMPQSRIKGARPGDENFSAKMFTQKMGQEIAKLRQQNNMTQVDLARKLNADVSMIRNIEKGGLISFNSEDVMVKEMAKILGVPSIKYQE